MLRYALRRIGLGVAILGVVMLGLYAAVFVLPGDPASVALGPRATPALKVMLAERMGLDRPIWEQALRFVGGVLTGDLGTDVWSNKPVAAQIGEVLPNTLILGFVSLTWAAALGVPLGVWSVMRRGGIVDAAVGTLSVALIAVPSFVVGLYALMLFAVTLRWLPAIGAGAAGDPLGQAAALVLPAFAIGLGWVGYLARMVRAAMLEVMAEPYIRTARAFGLPEWRVATRYGLRVAIIPTLSLVAVGLGGILTSAVFVEAVFTRPGIGLLITDAVATRNYPVVMGTVLVMTAIYVAITIAADLGIAALDPRIREAYRG